MKVEVLQDNLAPNGTTSEVTLYKSIKSDTILYKNSRGVILPVGSGGGEVFNGLSASKTLASNTNTTLNYGINVFTTITSTDYAARLPMPITGQTVVVVNNSASSLTLYPSMLGGKINNVLNGSAVIPPDGKPYSFFCTENPLPGEWTWSAPAIGQEDSGIISMSLTSGATPASNPLISAANNFFKTTIPNTISYAAGQDGKFKPLIQGVPNNGTGPIYFKPATAWNSITKIKVYTNASAPSLYYLQANGEISYYNNTTFNYLNNGPSVAAGFAWNQLTDNQIAGTPINAGYFQPYVGAPGTYWGELVFTNPNMASNNGASFTSSVIGDQNLGDVIYTGTFPSGYLGQLVNAFYSCYLSFQMKPIHNVNYGTGTFEFKFIIEHT